MSQNLKDQIKERTEQLLVSLESYRELIERKRQQVREEIWERREILKGTVNLDTLNERLETLRNSVETLSDQTKENIDLVKGNIKQNVDYLKESFDVARSHFEDLQSSVTQHNVKLKKSALPYYLGFIMPISAGLGLYLQSAWLFMPSLIVFFLFPFIDMVVGIDRTNLASEEEERIKNKLSFRLIHYLYVPFQVAIVAYSLILVATQSFAWWEWIGLLLSVSVVTGVGGMPIAHEMIHRRRSFEKFCGQILTLCLSYMHFSLEHVVGHHIHVSTPKDPTSAPLGESLYQFLPRTIIGSFTHAWKFEKRRMDRSGKPLIHEDNRMFWYTLLPILLWVGIAYFLGMKACYFFLAQSLLSIILIETVNYIEHYGLERKEIKKNRYEKVTPLHSWNTSHICSNYLTFNIQKHSDHHANPHLRYQVLRHFDESPQLPHGYPTLVMIALIPPLWHAMMDPRVMAVREEAEFYKDPEGLYL